MNLIAKEVKKATIAHYDRMIAWVEKQSPQDKVSYSAMYYNVGECCGSDDCPLCHNFLRWTKRSHHASCTGCPLNNTLQDCGKSTSFHRCMRESITWKGWLFYAKKLRWYISILPEVRE